MIKARNLRKPAATRSGARPTRVRPSDQHIGVHDTLPSYWRLSTVWCCPLLVSDGSLPLPPLRHCLPPRSAVAILVDGPAAGVLLTTDDYVGDPPPGLAAQPVTFQPASDPGGVAQPTIKFRGRAHSRRQRALAIVAIGLGCGLLPTVRAGAVVAPGARLFVQLSAAAANAAPLGCRYFLAHPRVGSFTSLLFALDALLRCQAHGIIPTLRVHLIQ